MSQKIFSNQSADQVISHLKRYLEAEESDNFNLKVDTFAKVVEVRKARQGSKGESKKRDKIREEMKGASSAKRKKMLSAKRREKPKLKHVRNGRMVNLRGYTGF